MSLPGEPRVAVVHEWLLDYAGSERVLREILEVFPGADLFVLVDRRDKELAGAITRPSKATTFLQHVPAPRRWLRYCVPLMPLAIGQLDLAGYDIVLSSSHVVAKGVTTRPGQLHLSYVHTPMRFAWDLQEEYLRAAGLDHGPLGWAARFALRHLRAWDVRSAEGVDAFLANSTHVGQRIKKAYGREAEILHPPIDTALFVPADSKEDFYLTVSRLEAYKRVDLLVEAFAAMPERRLIVIGDGPEMGRLRAAAPRNVSLPGRLATPDVRTHMQRARAFLFAGIEDFGIVMAEAQACGTPVIAFEDGGAVDIVRAGATGLLFREQTSGALTESIRRFESGMEAYTQSGCRENALRFDRKVFRQQFEAFVRRHWNDFARDRASSRPRNAVS